MFWGEARYLPSILFLRNTEYNDASIWQIRHSERGATHRIPKRLPRRTSLEFHVSVFVEPKKGKISALSKSFMTARSRACDCGHQRSPFIIRSLHEPAGRVAPSSCHRDRFRDLGAPSSTL